MNYQYLHFEVEGGVAWITFCRPERANTLNLEFARELHAVARYCDDHAGIRAVVIKAEGKIFCAGGDLAFFAAAGDELPAIIEGLLAEFHGAIEIFSSMNAPLIVAVNGAAAGVGLSIVAAASLAYATANAKFTMAYTNAGLSPDGSSTYHLPRLVGWRRCQELMLTNRVLSAAEAKEWGLVNDCYNDAAALDQAVSELARRLAAGPTQAFGQVRRLLIASGGRSLREQMDLEGRSFAQMTRSQDGSEGISAFMEKRRAVFVGR